MYSAELTAYKFRVLVHQKQLLGVNPEKARNRGYSKRDYSALVRAEYRSKTRKNSSVLKKLELQFFVKKKRFLVKILLLGFIGLLATGCRDAQPGQAATRHHVFLTASDKVRIARIARVQNAIGGVMAADAKTASLDDFSDRAKAMQLIDPSDCPRDFREAYAKHVQAWQKAAQIQQQLNQLANQANNGKAKSPGAARQSQDHEQQRQGAQLQRLAKKAQTEVRVTFDNVKTIAVSYDVSLGAVG